MQQKSPIETTARAGDCTVETALPPRNEAGQVLQRPAHAHRVLAFDRFAKKGDFRQFLDREEPLRLNVESADQPALHDPQNPGSCPDGPQQPQRVLYYLSVCHMSVTQPPDVASWVSIGPRGCRAIVEARASVAAPQSLKNGRTPLRGSPTRLHGLLTGLADSPNEGGQIASDLCPTSSRWRHDRAGLQPATTQGPIREMARSRGPSR